MKINIRKAQAKQKCEWLDDGLNYGINIAIVALTKTLVLEKNEAEIL